MKIYNDIIYKILNIHYNNNDKYEFIIIENNKKIKNEGKEFFNNIIELKKRKIYYDYNPIYYINSLKLQIPFFNFNFFKNTNIDIDNQKKKDIPLFLQQWKINEFILNSIQFKQMFRLINHYKKTIFKDIFIQNKLGDDTLLSIFHNDNIKSYSYGLKNLKNKKFDLMYLMIFKYSLKIKNTIEQENYPNLLKIIQIM